MQDQASRIVISIVLTSNSGELLLVKKGRSWFLPGGKVEPNETDTNCLMREMSEELPQLLYLIGEYYGEFNGLSPNSQKPTKAKIYLGNYLGGKINPSREISESKWVNREEFESISISEITTKVIFKLQEEGRL